MDNPENYVAAPAALYDKGIVSPGQSFDMINPRTGTRVTVVARDLGPGAKTGRLWDVAPHVADQLGLKTDEYAAVDMKQLLAAKHANAQPTPHPHELEQPLPHFTQATPAQGEAIRSAIGEYPTIASQEPTEESIQATGLGDLSPPSEELVDTEEAAQTAAEGSGTYIKGKNFPPPPPPTGHKVKLPDGRYQFDNGAIYDPHANAVTYKDDAGNLLYARDGYAITQLAPAGKGQKTLDQIASETAARKGWNPSDYSTPEEAIKARSAILGKPEDAIVREIGSIDIGDAKGEEVLNKVPKDLQGTIKAMTEYRYPKLSSFALRSPYYQKMLNIITAYDPNFDVKQYDARQKTLSAFASGKEAADIRSLNTVIGHLGEAHERFKDLGNKGLPIYNKIKNKFLTDIGYSSPKKFDTASETASFEIARALTGGVPNAVDIQHWREKFDNADSPEQFNGVVEEAVGLLSSRVGSYKDQWQKVFDKPPPFSLLNQESQNVLKKAGGEHGREAIQKYGGKPKTYEDIQPPEQTAAPPPLDDAGAYQESNMILADPNASPEEKSKAQGVLSYLSQKGFTSE